MEYQIKQSKKNNQWRVFLKAENNKTLLVSEQYVRLRDAKICAELACGKNSFPIKVFYADGTIEEYFSEQSYELAT